MRALVIDDSRAMRRILVHMMRRLGFEVFEADNGRQGWEVLDGETTPDVVLVDWNMPEMNGLEFVRAVRADKRFNDLPLMMVTTEMEMEKISEALTDGVSEYVMKPCTQEVLADKLQLLGLSPQLA